jgi:protein transport protein SEC24
MMIWVGGSVSPQVLIDLFGVDDINNVNSRMVRLSFPVVKPGFSNKRPFVPQFVLPELDSTLSIQVRNVITHRRVQRGRTSKLFVVRQNMDGAEIEFSDMLVEDQNNGALSYLDCASLFWVLAHPADRFVDLCVVHKNIAASVRPS